MSGHFKQLLLYWYTRIKTILNTKVYTEGVDRGGWGSGLEGAESGVEGAESGVEGAGRGAIVGGGLEKLEGKIAFLLENS